MGRSANFKDMQVAIMSWVKANMPKDKNKAHFGTVRGGSVIIGNKTFPYVPTVDLYFEDGDSVACIKPDSGNLVAVVGVL